MGYYTRYSLSVVEGEFDGDPEEILDDIHRKREDYYQYGFFEDEIKWYEHDGDMKEFSKMYPDVVFNLYGEGEEAGDIWSKYYKNGKYQVAKAEIVVEPFDESKLI